MKKKVIFSRFHFTLKGLNKTFALAALLLVCFTLSNCKKDVADFSEQPSLQTENSELETLAKQYPDNLFLAQKQGIPGRYIVMLKDSYLRPAVLDETESEVRPSELEDRSASRRKEVEAGVESFLDEKSIARPNVVATYGQLIAGFAANLTNAQVESLLADPRVASIEQDMEIAQNEVIEVSEEGNAESLAQATPCGIVRHGGSHNGSSSNKWIWIVNTGIQSNHPDLNVQTNPTFAKSFVGGSFEDCNGLGTHIAGTAAAKNNTIGVIGMSAGAKVVPIKVTNGCGTTYYISTLLSGLNHIASKDVPGDVVSLSLGGFFGYGSPQLKTAIKNLGNSGTWVVISAGDNSSFAGNYQPGSTDGTKILTIANMTCQKIWNNTSNYNHVTNGPPIDFIAVGTNVFSTYKNSSYAYLTGTGMSAAHVAGMVHEGQWAPIGYEGGTVLKNGVKYPVAYWLSL